MQFTLPSLPCEPALAGTLPVTAPPNTLPVGTPSPAPFAQFLADLAPPNAAGELPVAPLLMTTPDAIGGAETAAPLPVPQVVVAPAASAQAFFGSIPRPLHGGPAVALPLRPTATEAGADLASTDGGGALSVALPEWQANDAVAAQNAVCGGILPSVPTAPSPSLGQSEERPPGDVSALPVEQQPAGTPGPGPTVEKNARASGGDAGAGPSRTATEKQAAVDAVAAIAVVSPAAVANAAEPTRPLGTTATEAQCAFDGPLGSALAAAGSAPAIAQATADRRADEVRLSTQRRPVAGGGWAGADLSAPADLAEAGSPAEVPDGIGLAGPDEHALASVQPLVVAESGATTRGGDEAVAGVLSSDLGPEWETSAAVRPGGAAEVAVGSAAGASRGIDTDRLAPAPGGSPRLAVEKFAAAPAAKFGRAPMTSVLTPKSTLVTVGRGLVKADPGLGTASAEPAATMSSGSSTPASRLLDSVTSIEPATVVGAREAAVSKAEAPALPATVHRAVEAVLSAGDRLVAHGQHSVTLQFTVGGDPLAVRLEMRGGEVHTTFQTDSNELRAALAAEWQTVTAQPAGDRSLRLAEPVFTSSDFSAATTGGDTTRQNPSHGETPRPSSEDFSRARGPQTSSGAPAAAATPSPVSSGVPASSHHLHAVA